MNFENELPVVKNPKRVIAGRINGPRRRPWSSEDRERQRENALRQRPWLYATGPRTPEGKQRSAANGPHQHRPPGSQRAVRASLADVRMLIAASQNLRLMLASRRTPDFRQGALI